MAAKSCSSEVYLKRSNNENEVFLYTLLYNAFLGDLITPIPFFP